MLSFDALLSDFREKNQNSKCKFVSIFAELLLDLIIFKKLKHLLVLRCFEFAHTYTQMITFDFKTTRIFDSELRTPPRQVYRRTERRIRWPSTRASPTGRVRWSSSMR